MRLSLLIIFAASTLGAADATWAQVQTVLSARCTDCHGEKKQKAGLRLDSPEWLEKGSKEGAVVVAGKPELSKLYTMAALPEDHDDRMPPKGARLTAEQLDIIKSWIAAGAKTAALESPLQPQAKAPVAVPRTTGPGPADASATGPKKNDSDSPKSELTKAPPNNPADDMMGAAHEIAAAATKPKVAAITPAPEAAGVPAAGVPAAVVPAAVVPAAAVTTPVVSAPMAPEFAITALTTQQFVITTLPGGWLDVNAGHTKNGLTDAHLPLLAKIGPAVAFLDLANSGITDRQLKMLSDFTNLQRLHLERTPITDVGLSALSSCQHLSYVNVYGTAITDAGLAALRPLKQLDELYVWQSKVTPAGVAALKKELPDLTIITGPDDLPTVKLDGKKKKKK